MQENGRRDGVFAGCLMAVVLFLAPPALAQEDERPSKAEQRAIKACDLEARAKERAPEACIGKVSTPCQERPGMSSTVGTRKCFDREGAIWDALLNERYKRLQAKLSAEGGAKLRDVQKLWAKWRDAKCQMAYVFYEGGSMAGPLSRECAMSETGRRAIELGSALEVFGEKP